MQRSKLKKKSRRRQPMHYNYWPLASREYAHAAPTQSTDGEGEDLQAYERKDFTETVFWNAGIVTDERGVGSCMFNLSDSITTFRLQLDAAAHFYTPSVPGSSVSSSPAPEPPTSAPAAPALLPLALVPTAPAYPLHSRPSLRLPESVVPTNLHFSPSCMVGNVVGSADKLLRCVRPLTVGLRLPMFASCGDTLLVPVVLVNRTNETLSASQLDVSSKNSQALMVGEANVSANDQDNMVSSSQQTVAIAAASRARRLVRVQVGAVPGQFALQALFTAGPADGLDAPDPACNDSMSRSVTVVRSSFPIAHACAGVLGAGSPTSPASEASFSLPVSRDRVEGSTHARVSVHLAPASDLQNTLESLLRAPHGCFEQVAATMYPMILALEYFSLKQEGSLEQVKKAKQHLVSGYKKLAKYETKQRGFEWYGAAPPHAALTAYGILTLTALSKVWDGVDSSLVQRSVAWLQEQRDGAGGWKQSKGMYSFSRPPTDTANAFIMWALSESGAFGFVKEMDKAIRLVKQSRCSYITALLTLALCNMHQEEAGSVIEGTPVLETAQSFGHCLNLAQEDDGHVRDGKETITRSGGVSLGVETTALAVMAWIALDRVKHSHNISKGLRFLHSKKSSYGYYCNTQATAMCLQAIMRASAPTLPRPKANSEPPTLHVTVDGAEVATLILTGVQHRLKKSVAIPPECLVNGRDHALQLRLSGLPEDSAASVPFSVSVQYRSLQPESSAECCVSLAVVALAPVVPEGELSALRVTVTNTTDAPLPSVICIIPLPGGVTARRDKLQQLVKAGTIDFYELRGADVVVYWRGMHEAGQHEFLLDFVAEVPGTYTAAAARAYLYYTDEHVFWAAGAQLQVEAKDF